MKDYSCDHCGSTFRDYPSQRKSAKIFCSTPCKYAWNKTVVPHNKGKKAPEWVKEKLRQNHARLTGPTHGRWKGGRRTDKDGYVMIWRPTHPNSDYHGYVREHRLIIEEHLGRYLNNREVVHHLDLDKQNNKIENLELHNDSSSHGKEHYRTGTGGAGDLNNNPEKKAQLRRILLGLLSRPEMLTAYVAENSRPDTNSRT